MRFSQLDRIVEVVRGERLLARRALRADEPYLRDHFPHFPVMPGVLMLEAMFQAGMWLLLATDEFAFSMVTMQSARNVKYADFVTPGQVLTVVAEVVKRAGDVTTLKAHGTVSGQEKAETNAVSARLVLERYNLSDRYPERAASDPLLRRAMRLRYQSLCEAPDPRIVPDQPGP